MKVVHLNIKKEDDLRDRVLECMKKQIKKKFLVAGERNSIKPNCDAPFIVHNNIEQIQKTSI